MRHVLLSSMLCLCSPPLVAATWDKDDLSDAIDAAGATGVVEVPAGTHNVTGFDKTISHRLTLVGEGAEVSILQGGDELITSAGFELRNVQFLDWDSGITVDASDNAVSGIHVDSVTFDCLDNCFAGIHTTNDSDNEVSNVTVVNSSFLNMRGKAVRIHPYVSHIVIQGNTVIDLGNGTGGAIAFQAGGGAYINSSHNITISGNTFADISGADTSEAHAILVYGHAVSIDGNVIIDVNDGTSNHEAIYVKGSSISISNNALRDCGDGGDGWITLKGTTNAYTNSVTGNVLYGDDANAGIYSSDGILISGNQIEFSTTGGGINGYGSSSSYRYSVTGNDINVPGIGIDLKDIKNSTIANNTIISSGSEGIRLDDYVLTYPADGLIISDNVIDADSYAIRIREVSEGVRVVDNILLSGQSTAVAWSASSGKVEGNSGDLITENGGAKASHQDGHDINHGLDKTPTYVIVTGSVAGEMVSVSAITSTYFTVRIKDNTGASGTDQTVYWWAVHVH